MKRAAPVLLSFFCLASLCLAQPFPVSTSFTAKVVGVSDGDTITVYDGNQQTRIRIEGIDCPEDGADFSQRAKQHLSDLVFGKEVQLLGKELDQYGRLVARVYVLDTELSKETDVSLSLVEAGFAWHYKYYSNDPVLAAAETVARAKKVGVWSLPNPVPPWEQRAGGNVAPRGLLSASALASDSAPPSEAPQPSTSTVYHGNSKSRVYHGPGCRHYSCSNCTVQLGSKEEAARQGFRPHEQCAGSAASVAPAATPRPAVSSSSSSAAGVKQSGTVYHGNSNSKVYHAPGCQHYNCKNCTVALGSKDEASGRGFRPHGQCVR